MREAQAVNVLQQLGQQGITPRRLCADSRAVLSGEVFLAFPGSRSDGRLFIPDAVRRGAGAVVWERAGFSWDAQLRVPNVGADDLRSLAGYLAHLVYGRPSEALRLVGVTGTNGKTSVTHWIAQSWKLLGRRCAVIGTLGNGFPEALEPSPNTTPDPISLHRELARYVAEGASATAMEVSSIGLDQGRANGARFDVAVLTNLTRDHLDYHNSMEAYAQAKLELFRVAGLRCAVLNLDDALGRRIAVELAGSAVRRIGYVLDGRGIDPGLVETLISADNVVATERGLHFDALTDAGRVHVETALIGRFNVSNLLAVLGTLLASDVPLQEAAEVLSALVPPPGRMQMFGGRGEPLVVVDYAHTPDALEQALLALRDTAAARGGRLACVFGCGGERDPGKRPLMGAAATRCADLVWLTSDNPRREDPAAIVADIARGADARTRIVIDREAAIGAAIGAAHRTDVILIAGKGHESYQEAGGVRRPFSDAEQAARALARRAELPQ